MKTLSLIFLIVGLILAPAYWVYAKFFTGSQTAMMLLESVVAADNADTVWRSPPFQLQADMAPAGLILHVDATFSPTSADHRQPHDRYNVMLSREGDTAKPLLITLKGNGKKEDTPEVGNQQFKEHLVFMQTVKPGNYQVEIKPASVSVMKVEQMRLEIRQNLQEPNSDIVTGGIVLFVLGLLGLIAI